MKPTPNFSIENEYPNMTVIGVDEAGRGPLAGPVIASAVIWPQTPDPWPLITDSKQMTLAKRNAAYDWITKNTTWAIGIASAEEIDEINILQASLLAMKRAVENLPCHCEREARGNPVTPEPLELLDCHARRHDRRRARNDKIVLVDGNRPIPDLNCRPVVRGDSKSLSIAAASIIAKVTRDKIMNELHKAHPEYGWDKNAGYPTKSHIAAINEHGITEHHRRTFKPIKN